MLRRPLSLASPGDAGSPLECTSDQDLHVRTASVDIQKQVRVAALVCHPGLSCDASRILDQQEGLVTVRAGVGVDRRQIDLVVRFEVHERIGSANERVGDSRIFERVGTRTTEDGVGTGAADQRIAALAGIEGVVASAAVD